VFLYYKIELILEENKLFICFYFCIGSKITEIVNYVIILGGIVGKDSSKKKTCENAAL